MVWETLPDGTRWRLDWREDMPVSDEMQQFAEAVQRQMAEHLALHPPPAFIVPESAGVSLLGDFSFAPMAVNVVHDPHILQPLQSSATREAWAQRVSAHQAPLSSSGVSGIQPEPPDTPFEEWCAGVEALLAECAEHQAKTEEVLRDAT